MRRLTWAALAAGLLLLTPTGSAQIIDPPGFGVAITAQGTACTTAGACALIPLSTMPSVTIQIVGTFSATLQFEGTSDGQTWGAVQATKLSDGTVATSTTTTGQYTVSNVGLQQVRVRCSSFVSGVASVTGVRGYAMSGGRSSFFPSLTVTQGTLSGADASALSTTATWNDAAVTFNHWKAVITDTASAVGSLALSIKGGAAGSTNLLSVSKAGAGTFGGAIVAGGDVTASASSVIGWSGRSVMESATNGEWRVENAARSFGIVTQFLAVPTITGNNCGTTGTISSDSTDTVGEVTMGAAGTLTICTVNFGSTWTKAPKCFASVNTTTAANARAIGANATTTALILTPSAAFVASDKVDYFCMSNK